MTAPPERLAQFQNLRNVGTDFRAGVSQAKRRQDALARQKEKRQQAFSLARGGLESVLDELDLEQTSSESEDEGASSLHQQSRLEDQEHNDSQFEDADESGEAATNASMDVKDDVMGTQGEAGHAERASRRGKSRKSNMPKRIKQKYRIYANRLMQGEDLDMEHEGLPTDLAGEWLAIGPVPKGKRCMVVTFNSTRKSQQGRVTNAILLSRTTGKPIVRQHVPVLPPDCVLDCIYSAETATLFCADVLQWKRQSVAESDAEFRMFWRDSKLAELPIQTIPVWPSENQHELTDADMEGENGDQSAEPSNPTSKRPSHLLIVPIPCLGASDTFPLSLMQEMVLPALSSDANQVNMTARPVDSPSSTVQHDIPYSVSGITLLVRSAAYEAGLTPLAAWIPRAQLQKLASLLGATR